MVGRSGSRQSAWSRPWWAVGLRTAVLFTVFAVLLLDTAPAQARGLIAHCPIASLDNASSSDFGNDTAEVAVLCKLPEADSPTGSDRNVPICTTRATSGIAPLRLLAANNARIETTSRCRDHSLLPQLAPSSPDDTPRAPTTAADATLANELPRPPAATPCSLLERLAIPTGQRAGVRAGVFRPPRG